MKTDRRKELKQNQLADYLAKWIVVVKPYTRLICGVVIAVVVASGVMAWLKSESEQTVEEAWNVYLLKGMTGERGRRAADYEVLAKLFADKADQPVGQWASISSADHRRARGVSLVLQFGGWELGQKELRTAIQEYEVVLGGADRETDDLLRQTALFGQAKAYESLGELAEAKQRYEQLADAPVPYFARSAKQRLADVDTEATKRFYIELKNTVASQPNPFGTFGNVKSDPLKEKSDRLKLPDLFGDGDFGRLLGFPPLVPDETTPEDTVPNTPKKDDAKVDDAKVDDAKVDDAKVDDTKVDDTKADDTKADDTKADDTKKDDAKADDTKAGDAETSDVKNDSTPKSSETVPDSGPKQPK